jgi:hypothetical protein
MRIVSRKSVLFATAAAATATLTTLATLVAAPAGAAQSWQISLKVTGSSFPAFTAVTASSSSDAWAFSNPGNAAPGAYWYDGSTWSKAPSFPDPKGDQVISASSSSSGNVWAFTFQGRVLHYNGSNWSVVKKFSKPIESGLAISSTNVWVFGNEFGDALGTWHYNGGNWTRSSSGSGLSGGYALSAGSIWAYGGADVAHWNGVTWKKTSLAHLLPKKTEFSRWAVAGIYAASAKNVYAVASGDTQDEGGPVGLLHYNGSKWTRLFRSTKAGGPIAIVPDGNGGLWIPVAFGQGESSMDHWSGGAMHSVTLPYSPAHLVLFGAANGPGSKNAITVGFYRKSFSSVTSTAVILRYGS